MLLQKILNIFLAAAAKLYIAYSRVRRWSVVLEVPHVVAILLFSRFFDIACRVANLSAFSCYKKNQDNLFPRLAIDPTIIESTVRRCASTPQGPQVEHLYDKPYL